MRLKGPVSVLALGGMFGIAYLGSTILVLSFLPTGYSPIGQYASDYGVGRFAVEMNVGFLLGGIGFVALALAVALARAFRGSRIGSSFLFIAGSALVVNAFFPADIEGSPATPHGTIHGLAGVVFFITVVIGILIVSHGLGRGRFLATLSATVIAVVFVAANAVLSLDATGLAERIVILIAFSAGILASYHLAGISSGEHPRDQG